MEMGSANRLMPLLLLACLLCLLPCTADDGSETQQGTHQLQAEYSQCHSSLQVMTGELIDVHLRVKHYNSRYATEASLKWLTCLLGAMLISMVAVAAESARQRRLRAQEKAHFEAREMHLQACCHGIRNQAADLGQNAVAARQREAAAVEKYNALADKFNVNATKFGTVLAQVAAATNQLATIKVCEKLSGCMQQHTASQLWQTVLAALVRCVFVVLHALHTLVFASVLQAASTPATASQQCQTAGELDALAPGSPTQAGEVFSPHPSPQLEAEASIPELSDLVGAAVGHNETAKSKCDQITAVQATLKDNEVQTAPSAKQPNIQQAGGQQEAATNAQTLGKSPAAATQFATPASAASLITCGSTGQTSPPLNAAYSSTQQCQSPFGQQQQPAAGVNSGAAAHGGDWVTQGQLEYAVRCARLEAENERLKEKYQVLESQVKAQQPQLLQSPVILSALGHPGYVNTRRGAATPPAPLVPSSAGSFSSRVSPGSAFLHFGMQRGGIVADGTEQPASVGSARQSTPGQSAGGVVSTPGSSAISSRGRAAEHTPLPMQPLENVGSPAGNIVPSPGQQQPPAKSTGAAQALRVKMDELASRTAQVSRYAGNLATAQCLHRSYTQYETRIMHGSH